MEEKKKHKIKIKDGKTELELEKREAAFGAPDYEEYEKKMKKKAEMKELDRASAKTNTLLSADEIIENEVNEKKQNKEQALLVYFQRINLYRFHKQEHEEFVNLFEQSVKADESEVVFSDAPISPETGLKYSTKMLALKCQELHMALRIEARKIEQLKVDLLKDFGVDDNKLEDEWTEWFG